MAPVVSMCGCTQSDPYRCRTTSKEGKADNHNNRHNGLVHSMTEVCHYKRITNIYKVFLMLKPRALKGNGVLAGNMDDQAELLEKNQASDHQGLVR